MAIQLRWKPNERVKLMPKSVSVVLKELERQLREELDPLGFVDGDGGAFMTGHEPHKFPKFYLFRRYAGLNEEGIQAAERECDRHISEPYRKLLTHMNGASVLGVSLHGAIGSLVDRSGQDIGQPISIRYQNSIERPDYIPQGHLGIGAINGDWYSQGHLYLTSTGEVELYNAKFDLIGAKWPSLADFLSVEIPRRLNFHDEAGLVKSGAKKLPGDTDNWEKLAQEAEQSKKAEGSLIGRVGRFFRSR